MIVWYDCGNKARLVKGWQLGTVNVVRLYSVCYSGSGRCYPWVGGGRLPRGSRFWWNDVWSLQYIFYLHAGNCLVGGACFVSRCHVSSFGYVDMRICDQHMPKDCIFYSTVVVES
jgi:hypothetical protein